MSSTSRQAELRVELAALNATYDAALLARTTWMNAHMADFAEYPIGTELFDRETGRSIGTVTGYYRYHGPQLENSMQCRDERFDRSMEISYQTFNGQWYDNTSSRSGLVESAAERAARLESEAKWLKNGTRSPFEELLKIAGVR